MYLLAAYSSALLGVQSSIAGTSFEELYKAICLLYRYLSEFTVCVENVEYVALGDLF